MVKVSAALTMLMFVGGLVNSLLSLLTFQNKDLRKVGCGIYLLASSITSFFTISMFTVKFWYVVVTQMNSSISLSVFRGSCISIEPLLKFFVYLDSWLNACVAVERTVNVSKGINFNKEKSRRIARWVIVILPLCIMGTIIHEPVCRDLFKYQTEKYILNETGTNRSEEYDEQTDNSKGHDIWTNKSGEYVIETHVWCVTHYSPSVQNYNTAILFFHLVSPFIINLFSAIFIIFGVARRRSTAQDRQTYKQHVSEQLSEHKQLIISPVILSILASPRLIISLLSRCIDISENSWLFLLAYFISFTPSMLVFIVFVLPSELYKTKFKESITRWRRQTHQ